MACELIIKVTNILENLYKKPFLLCWEQFLIARRSGLLRLGIGSYREWHTLYVWYRGLGQGERISNTLQSRIQIQYWKGGCRFPFLRFSDVSNSSHYQDIQHTITTINGILVPTWLKGPQIRSHLIKCQGSFPVRSRSDPSYSATPLPTSSRTCSDRQKKTNPQSFSPHYCLTSPRLLCAT